MIGRTSPHGRVKWQKSGELVPEIRWHAMIRWGVISTFMVEAVTLFLRFRSGISATAFNKTPHDVVLRLGGGLPEELAEGRLGLGDVELPCLVRGLDSHRGDVQYEDFEGHKLDRKLLDLLQRY